MLIHDYSKSPERQFRKKFVTHSNIKLRFMSDFKLVSQFEPAGDQPKAIHELLAGLERDDKFQTLLGITGSGKTRTIASVIEKYGRPTLVMSHNKTLAAQLYRELSDFFPE